MACETKARTLRLRALWPLILLTVYSSEVPSSSECSANGDCGVLGSAMLQASFSSIHGGASDKQESQTLIKSNSSHGTHHSQTSTKNDTAHDATSLTAQYATNQASQVTSGVWEQLMSLRQDPDLSPADKAAEKAADEPESAPSFLFNLALFVGFACTILFILLIILGFLQLVAYFIKQRQAAYLERLEKEKAEKKAKEEKDKPAEAKAKAKPEPKKEAGNTKKLKRSKTMAERKDMVKEAADKLIGIKLWKRLNGDAARLGMILSIAYSGDPDAQAKDLVQRACKAYKLRLSNMATQQVSEGLITLTEAVKQQQQEQGDRGIVKFRRAANKVRALVRVSLAFKGTADESKSMALFDGPGGTGKESCMFKAIKAKSSDRVQAVAKIYADGEKAQIHGQFQDTRLQKTKLGAYFAGAQWLDHSAIAVVFIYSQLCALVYAMYLKTRFPKMYAFMGPWLLVSRGEAMAVIILSMMMVVLLSRGLITKLRPLMSWSTVLATICDKHVLIHKCIGVMLVICAFLHILGHLRGSIPAIVGETDAAKINAAFTYGTKIRFNFNSWATAAVCWPAVTGYILVLILIAFWSLSNIYVRKYWFELFHYPHLILIVAWCAALIAHGWKQWLGIGVPLASVSFMPVVIFYFAERMHHIRHGDQETIRIANAVIKKSNVLLEIETGSTGFSFSTGMYCMLKVPEISNFQWHPFTIASGGGKSKFCVLFATIGDWTNRLKTLLDEAQKLEKDYPKICVRGGYGAPATGMKDKEHIILVGAGVGATPFLSFLSNICSSCEEGAVDQFKDVKSAVFYWLSREPNDFMWVNEYTNIINAEPKLRDKVKIRLCLTKSLDTEADGDNKDIGLFWLGLEVALTKLDSPDLKKELGVPTQFGRPKWPKEFAKVQEELTTQFGKAPDDVSVFVCGNKMLVDSLEEACEEMTDRSIKFRLFAEEF